MKIKIGADELILWIRKNRIASTTPNDEINGLGIKIYKIIKEYGGHKIMDNDPCLWPTPEDDAAIGKFMLPKTAAQYEVDVEALPEIYKDLAEL